MNRIEGSSGNTQVPYQKLDKSKTEGPSSSSKIKPPTGFQRFKSELKTGMPVAILPVTLGIRFFAEQTNKAELLKLKATIKDNMQADGKVSIKVGQLTISYVHNPKLSKVEEYKNHLKAHIQSFRNEFISEKLQLIHDFKQDPVLEKLYNETIDKLQPPVDDFLPLPSDAREALLKNLNVAIKNAKEEGDDDLVDKLTNAKEKINGVMQKADSIITVINELQKIPKTSLSQKIKTVAKCVGFTAALIYLAINWVPVLPILAFMAVANATSVGLFNRQLDGRKGRFSLPSNMEQ